MMDDERDSYGYTKLENDLVNVITASAFEYAIGGRKWSEDADGGIERLMKWERRLLDDIFDCFKRNNLALVPKEDSAINRLMQN